MLYRSGKFPVPKFLSVACLSNITSWVFRPCSKISESPFIKGTSVKEKIGFDHSRYEFPEAALNSGQGYRTDVRGLESIDERMFSTPTQESGFLA